MTVLEKESQPRTREELCYLEDILRKTDHINLVLK